MKRIISAALAVLIVITVGTVSASCSKSQKQDESWKTNDKYDLSVPVLGQDGWYLVFEDDFNGTSLNEDIKFGDTYTGNARFGLILRMQSGGRAMMKISPRRRAIGAPKRLKSVIQS